MALRQAFKDDLSATYRSLGDEQRRLERLRDLAEHDGLPSTVVSILARKAKSLGYMREDLRGIPDKVTEAEARR